MFGQFPPGIAPLWFGRVDGAVPPLPPLPFVAGAGEADGSGLAADTTAAAPPTSNSADSAAVRTMRLRPGPDGPAAGDAASVGDAGGAIDGGGVRGAGMTGWTGCSTVHSFGHGFLDIGGSVAQPMGTSGPVGSGVARLSSAGPTTDLASIVPAHAERGLRRSRRLSGSCQRGFSLADSGDAAHRGVDRAEEPARDATDQSRVGKTGGHRDPLPGAIADRVGYPRVATLRVVLDDDE